MSKLDYMLAVSRHYRLLAILTRLKLIIWAILGRPIISGVTFQGLTKLAPGQKNILITNNTFYLLLHGSECPCFSWG